MRATNALMLLWLSTSTLAQNDDPSPNDIERPPPGGPALYAYQEPAIPTAEHNSTPGLSSFDGSSFSEPYCVDKPPQGTCYTAEVCNTGNVGEKPCDYYTVTYNKNGNKIDEACKMDPKRPRCGRQAGGQDCDPHNGYGTCCSNDGYCGGGKAYCDITKDCENCPSKGCQSGKCENRPRETTDNKCGAQHGGKLCNANLNAGTCCSKGGECGSSPDHCDSSTGCQSGCTTGTSTGNRCGKEFGSKSCPQGHCCSSFGFCGSSADHCGVGCQNGSCAKPAQENRCGPAFNGKKCPNGNDCCSSEGYCGTTTHCKTGCHDGPCEPEPGHRPKCSSEKPDQIFACLCKPGEQPIWQSIANAPCTTTTDPCPEMDGAVLGIDGWSWKYHCKKKYVAWSSTVTSGRSLDDCRKQCAATSNCRAVNYWKTDQGSCQMQLGDGSFYDSSESAFGGTVVKTPTPSGTSTTDGNKEERMTGEATTEKMSCPESHNKRVLVGSDEYEVRCDHWLGATPYHIHTVENLAECNEKCSQDPKCEGATYSNSQSATSKPWCALKSDGKAEFIPQKDEQSFKKVKPQDQVKETPEGSIGKGWGTFDPPQNTRGKVSCPESNGKRVWLHGEQYKVRCDTDPNADTLVDIVVSDADECFKKGVKECSRHTQCDGVVSHYATRCSTFSRNKGYSAFSGYQTLEKLSSPEWRAYAWTKGPPGGDSPCPEMAGQRVVYGNEEFEVGCDSRIDPLTGSTNRQTRGWKECADHCAWDETCEAFHGTPPTRTSLGRCYFFRYPQTGTSKDLKFATDTGNVALKKVKSPGEAKKKAEAEEGWV